MEAKEIRTSVKTVYGMLWDVLALYEKTDGYNKMPAGKQADNIWDYMEACLLEIRREIVRLFLGEREMQHKLMQIVNETECFVKSYTVPGVVKRWKRLNPKMIFFDCAFEILNSDKELFRQMQMGLSDAQLSCYPDEKLCKEREQYFATIRNRMQRENLQYSEARIFQDELLRTLTLVFEEDFKKYL